MVMSTKNEEIVHWEKKGLEEMYLNLQGLSPWNWHLRSAERIISHLSLY